MILKNLQDPKQLIVGVLNIIHYPEDKEKFVEDFFSLCIQETMVVMVKSLPEDDQKDFQIALSHDFSADGVQKTIAAYFSEETYHRTLQKITQEIFNEFVRTASSKASEEEKKKLHTYFKSFSANN